MGHYTFDVDVMSPNECLEYNYLYFHLRGFQPLLEIDEDKFFFKVMMSGRMGDRMVIVPISFFVTNHNTFVSDYILKCHTDYYYIFNR